MEILNTKKAIAKYVNDNFTSQSVNKILFGFEEMENADARRPNVLYRMLALTFMAIYTKWLGYGRKCFSYAVGKNARNVFDLLQITYKTQPFNLDVVVYALSEAKRDVTAFGEKSFFYEFFTEDVDCKYSTMYEVLRIALETGVSEEALVIEKMGLAVQDLKILRRLEVLDNGNGKSVTLKSGDAEYNAHDLIIWRDGGICLLQDRIVVENNIERHYRSLENFSQTITIEKLDLTKKGV